MKVLIVTPSYFPIVGGSETLVRLISTKLSDNGIHVDIMTYNIDKKWVPILKDKVDFEKNTKIFRIFAVNLFPFLRISPLNTPFRINIFPMPTFRKRFKDYDIIHFLGEADLSMPLFSYSIKKPKIMHCVGIPGLDKMLRRHITLKKYFAWVFSRIANIFIVFSTEEKLVLTNIGIQSKRVLVLPYGIDTDVFRPDEGKRLDNLILFVGRIDHVKGLHVLLASLTRLTLKTRVVIIGPAVDPAYFKQIDRIRTKLNKAGVHSVEYLGQLDQSDLIPWYQKATVLVRADLVGASGAGISTLEALACGTPVIGVQNHVIQDGINGLIIPPNDPEKLAIALQKIIRSRKLRKDYGEAARRMIEEDYSWQSHISRLSVVYKNLAKS